MAYIDRVVEARARDIIWNLEDPRRVIPPKHGQPAFAAFDPVGPEAAEAEPVRE